MADISGSKPVPNLTPSTKDSHTGVQSKGAAAASSDVSNASLQKPGVAAIPEYARNMNDQDIRNTLLNLGKPPTAENQQIVMVMISYGVEASIEAFEMLEQFSKGKKKGNKLESSVISYSKGLGVNSKSVGLISNFLSHNIQMSSAIEQFYQRMQRFNGSLSNYKNILNAELFAGISGVVSDFLKDIKNMKNRLDKLDIKGFLSKEGSLVQDLKYLQEFLKGLDSNLSSKNNLLAEDLQQLLKRVVADSGTLHDVLLTQLVLSRSSQNNLIADNFFHYWMIPNPFVQGARDIEMLVAKDKENPKLINPDKTKIVLKCETSALGDLTIIIEIDGRQMVHKIYSGKELTQKYVADYTPDLKKSMTSLNYDLLEVKSYKKFNIQKILFPKFDLNKIQRISTEV